MSLKTSLAGAATALGLSALAYPAQAALLYNFTYTHGGPGATTPIIVSGTLIGTPSTTTPGTIEVTGFSNLVYNGVALNTSPNWQPTATPAPFVQSYSGALTATASFSGTSLDFALTDSSGTNYVAFGPSASLQIFTSVFDSTTTLSITNGLSGAEQLFNSEAFAWTLQPAGVPEPASVVALLGLGLGALASRVRKQG